MFITFIIYAIIPGNMTEQLRVHPEYNPVIVSQTLQARGWDVNFRKSSEVDLIPTAENGYIECMDPRKRPSGLLGMIGPSILGGTYLVMAEQTGGTIDGLAAANHRIRKLGYRSGIHGDHDHQERGCGFCNLWMQEELPLRHKLEEDPRVIAQTLAHPWIDGSYISLEGGHGEDKLVVNPILDRTIRKNGLEFITDIWFALSLGMDQRRVLNITAQAIERLGRPKVADLVEV
jgi:hypothetical protein